MKRFLLMTIFFLGLFFMLSVYAINKITIQIQLQQAKNIYNTMTGPEIKNEGAAGHLYRTGKSIVCKYINADMDDSSGHPIPGKDPRRYICKMKFNDNGLAMPAT